MVLVRVAYSSSCDFNLPTSLTEGDGPNTAGRGLPQRWAKGFWEMRIKFVQTLPDAPCHGAELARTYVLAGDYRSMRHTPVIRRRYFHSRYRVLREARHACASYDSEKRGELRFTEENHEGSALA
jgi:hypothetical protein